MRVIAVVLTAVLVITGSGTTPIHEIRPLPTWLENYMPQPLASAKYSQRGINYYEIAKHSIAP